MGESTGKSHQAHQVEWFENGEEVQRDAIDEERQHDDRLERDLLEDEGAGHGAAEDAEEDHGTEAAHLGVVQRLVGLDGGKCGRHGTMIEVDDDVK